MSEEPTAHGFKAKEPVSAPVGEVAKRMNAWFDAPKAAPRADEDNTILDAIVAKARVKKKLATTHLQPELTDLPPGRDPMDQRKAGEKKP